MLKRHQSSGLVLVSQSEYDGSAVDILVKLTILI